MVYVGSCSPHWAWGPGPGALTTLQLMGGRGGVGGPSENLMTALSVCEWFVLKTEVTYVSQPVQPGHLCYTYIKTYT